jgi:hypothetical protein
MRHLFFSLLILLTAFRGMAGDAMAYDMTSGMTQQLLQQTHATESVASRAYSMPATGHFSSENQASMPCHEAAEQTTDDSSSHACTTCQVCHLTASLPSIMQSAAIEQLARDLQAAPGSSWLSAELQRTSKPPIL